MHKFKIGDVVTYIKKKGSWNYGSLHIIHKVEYRGNRIFEYATSKGAWFKEKDFKLHTHANELSMKKLDADIEEDHKNNY